VARVLGRRQLDLLQHLATRVPDTVTHTSGLLTPRIGHLLSLGGSVYFIEGGSCIGCKSLLGTGCTRGIGHVSGRPRPPTSFTKPHTPTLMLRRRS